MAVCDGFKLFFAKFSFCFVICFSLNINSSKSIFPVPIKYFVFFSVRDLCDKDFQKNKNLSNPKESSLVDLTNI